jgi:hypothetical protein
VRRLALLITLSLAGVLASSATPGTAREADYFSVRIRDALYGARAFHVTGEATFNLQGCNWSTCDEVVQATFTLRRKSRYGPIVSRDRTETYARTSTLTATLPTFARCRRPGPMTRPDQVVHHTYWIVLRATAYTGQVATERMFTFTVCRKR